MIVLRVPVVSLLFQHGAFSPENTVECAAVAMTALLGLWAVAGTRNLAQAFYATRDTATPVKVAIGSFVLNVLCSLALIGPMGAPGLTLANSISSAFNFLGLGVLLSRKTGGWGHRHVMSSAAKSLLASAVMGAAVYPFSAMPIWLLHGRYMTKGLLLLAAVLTGGLVYGATAYFLKQPELESAIKKIRTRFAKK